MYFFEKQPKDIQRAFLITDHNKNVTYEERNSFCRRIGMHLESRRLVFLLCTNTAGSILGYVSFLRLGVVPLLLDAGMDGELLDRLLEIYRPDYIYAPEKKKNEWGEPDFQEWDYGLWKRDNKEETALYPQLALLLTTSGSTGNPKLVRLSYENLQENTQSIAEYLELTEKERPITSLPMHYTYGLSVLHSHMNVCAPILVTGHGIMEAEFWDFFEKEKASSIAGVPYTYEILKKLRFCEKEHPYLKTMTQAGGKLSANLQQEFGEYAEQWGKHFVVMYGQTEATARMSYLPWKDVLRKNGSIGIPVPGGRFLISPEGELIYYGKNVSLGYAENRADLCKADERKGVLPTGDIARIDEEGYYYLVGRKKRFVKIMGKRINPDDAERLLQNHFGLEEVVCIGNDEKIQIYVEKKETDEDEIISYISEKLGLGSGVFSVRVLDAFPRNEAGKIQYKFLERMQ